MWSCGCLCDLSSLEIWSKQSDLLLGFVSKSYAFCLCIFIGFWFCCCVLSLLQLLNLITPSCLMKSLIPFLFGSMEKIILLGSFNSNYLSKGKIYGSYWWKKKPAPTSPEDLAKWEIKDAQIMTWILSSVEAHFILNLRPYKAAKEMWDYLKKVYN